MDLRAHLRYEKGETYMKERIRGTAGWACWGIVIGGVVIRLLVGLAVTEGAVAVTTQLSVGLILDAVLLLALWTWGITTVVTPTKVLTKIVAIAIAVTGTAITGPAAGGAPGFLMRTCKEVSHE